MKRFWRLWCEAAHAINDPIPGEKWIAAGIVAYFLWTVFR